MNTIIASFSIVEKTQTWFLWLGWVQLAQQVKCIIRGRGSFWCGLAWVVESPDLPGEWYRIQLWNGYCWARQIFEISSEIFVGFLFYQCENGHWHYITFQKKKKTSTLYWLVYIWYAHYTGKKKKLFWQMFGLIFEKKKSEFIINGLTGWTIFLHEWSWCMMRSWVWYDDPDTVLKYHLIWLSM